MMTTTPTVDISALAKIRQSIATFLHDCGLQYTAVKLDEAWHDECSQEAISRGLPMDGKYSIRPFIVVGAAIASNPYGHLISRSARIWICLYTAIGSFIDDTMNKGEDIADIYRFNERFAVHHHLPLASNLIVASTLNYMSSLMLDHETKDMEISIDALLYPEYSRFLSDATDAYGVFIFPPTLPLVEYIQCMPDLAIVLNHTNDILSYYKEELVGETMNYLSLTAYSRAITKQEALDALIEKTVQAHRNVLQILKPHPEAYNIFLSFFHGYFEFHAAIGRYKLEEIMSKRADILD